MGNREALLEGAKQCILDKGYDRTTVRDITAAAGGVSMAAIGYHFGSREALLMEALVSALEDWGASVGAVLAGSTISGEGYAGTWDRMLRTGTQQRALWMASYEALLQSERSPELRAMLARGQQEGRRGVTAWLAGIPEDAVPEDLVRTLGSVQMALMSGLIGQMLLDPDNAPSGAEITRGLRELADRLET
ncbi:TetR/AcrR family transcriptional regulator [Hoyosella altamirensis]|uniref:AcrR family transcriptional regulator n=1 Tax=Hoyosella altamirensis TaxID=616997 RepID=A0A839RNT7_9ACTN|nr:TetR/AcrR family transcriptional regulator [Hoyosella altamirensis]MBB3038170.1 AcrR family transcriptional regulator [Hoyosella altamirensis]